MRAASDVILPPNIGVDEADMLDKSTFPIPPAELLELARRFILTKSGLDDPSILADDFQFIFPFVGPLSKTEFLAAVSTFNLEEAFPDLKQNTRMMSVDAFEPNRVWYFVQPEGTNLGPLNVLNVPTIPSTGIKVLNPPQVHSITFNEEGKIVKFTGGYPVDRTIGNTGGLGGIFGYLKAIGRPLPFPEASTYFEKRSLVWRLLVGFNKRALRRKGRKMQRQYMMAQLNK